MTRSVSLLRHSHRCLVMTPKEVLARLRDRAYEQHRHYLNEGDAVQAEEYLCYAVAYMRAMGEIRRQCSGLHQARA